MSPLPRAPKVSIVVPLYNGEGSIERTLDSVRAQDIQDWEMLVVDDRSSDASRSLVRGYIARTNDSRISLIEQQRNSGPSAARNVGVGLSTGEFLAFLDADDELLPGALEHLLEMAQDSDIDIAAGAHIARTSSGRETPRPDTLLGTLTGVDAVEGLLQERIWNYTHGKLYRRRLFEHVAFREDIRRYEDIIFNACAFSFSRKVTVSAHPVHRYFIDASSTTWTQKLTADFVHDTEDFIRKGLNRNVAAQISQRSWRTMRATLAVVVLSNAIAGNADGAALRELQGVLRRNVRFRDLPDVLRTAPMIGVSSIAASLVPGLYAWAYRRYVARAYELGS